MYYLLFLLSLTYGMSFSYSLEIFDPELILLDLWESKLELFTPE